MATVTTAKGSCVRCPNGPGQVNCDGCQQHFCLTHFPEHRQELSQQIDTLAYEYNQLQRNLTEESTDQPHPLLACIDRWELQSIERIKQVSNEVRSQLRESLAQTKKNIRESLHQIVANLEENRRAEAFTEIDLQGWGRQLEELKEELEKRANVELIEGEDGVSSTHIPLIQLRRIDRMKGKSHVTTFPISSF